MYIRKEGTLKNKGAKHSKVIIVIIKENFDKLDHTRLRTSVSQKTNKPSYKQKNHHEKNKKGKLQRGKIYLYHKTNKIQNLWQLLQINKIDNNTMDKNPK